MIELREWARAELEGQGYDVVAFGPAFTRLSDMGGPRLPNPQQPSPAEPAPAETGPPARVSWQLADTMEHELSDSDLETAPVPSSHAS